MPHGARAERYTRYWDIVLHFSRLESDHTVFRLTYTHRYVRSNAVYKRLKTMELTT